MWLYLWILRSAVSEFDVFYVIRDNICVEVCGDDEYHEYQHYRAYTSLIDYFRCYGILDS
jgi:hypothetical protein